MSNINSKGTQWDLGILILAISLFQCSIYQWTYVYLNTTCTGISVIENHKQHLHVFNIYCFIFYNNAQNYTSVVHIISWGKGNL